MDTQAVVALHRRNFVQLGIPPDQADALIEFALELTDQRVEQKMQNVLTQDYLDAALERFAAQVRTEVKQEIAELRTEMKDLKHELKLDIASVRTEIASVRNELTDKILDRHDKQLVWMTVIIGLALGAARLLFF